MKLVIGNDHAAVEMKNEIMAYLESRGIQVINVGTDTAERFDYPIAAYRAAKLVASGEVDQGVLICGTGIGISLTANKVPGIRAAVCSEPYSAAMAKRHNNAQIIAFGARVIGVEMAKMILDSFFGSEFEGGRHAGRVERMMQVEADYGKGRA